MGYIVVLFEFASSNTFRDIPKNHFVTAEVDIYDSIKRKRIRVSLNNCCRVRVGLTGERIQQEAHHQVGLGKTRAA